MPAGSVPAAGDQPQNVGNISTTTAAIWKVAWGAVVDDLRADFVQLLAQTGQRPRLRPLGHRKSPHEIAER